MMDIKAWLEENGMSEHWEKFESNKIDEDTLKSMTENDLKDIGIDALGDRKTLIAGINRLSGASSSDSEGSDVMTGVIIGGVIGAIIGFGGCMIADNRGNTSLATIGGLLGATLGAVLGAIIKK